jgi:Subtilase family
MARIVVELDEGLVERLVARARTGVPDHTSLAEIARELGIEPLSAMLERWGKLASSQLMPNRSILSQVNRKHPVFEMSPDESLGLAGFFTIDVGKLSEAEQNQVLEGLKSLKGIVESAAFESKYRGANKQRAGSHGPIYRRAQTYLDALGVRSPDEGEWFGVGFATLDQGWNLDHESLKHIPPPVLFPSGFEAQAYGKTLTHGTSVLGICVGGGKIQGIAKGAAVKALLFATDTQAIAETILGFVNAAGLDSLAFGDILLIEIEQDGVAGGLPLEVQPAIMKAIRRAVSEGIVVIEVAGNGTNTLGSSRVGWDLDVIAKKPEMAPAWETKDGSASVDSGAILVSGCVPRGRARPKTYDADPELNFGTRIDCYGWGSGVLAPGDDDPPTAPKLPAANGDYDITYDCGFNGTSAAAAMVTGLALAIQRMAWQELGHPLSPTQLRALLRDPRCGVPVRGVGKPTRVVPHLASIRKVLQHLPRLMIKMFDLDDGGPDRVANVTADSQSPDIFLCARHTGAPQKQHDPITAGTTAYVYVGVRNLRASTAVRIRAGAYWSIHNDDAEARVTWEELAESAGHVAATGHDSTLLGPIDLTLPSHLSGTKVDIVVAARGAFDPHLLIAPTSKARIRYSRSELVPLFQYNVGAAIRTFELV